MTIARRPVEWRVVLKLLCVLVAALVCVYVIGWAITWIRLRAAHLPVGAALSMISDLTLFVAGLRFAGVMVIVFAAMCVVAWAVHAWTWQRRAPEWHSVIEHGRVEAARRHRRTFRRGSLKEALAFSSSPPVDLVPAPVGDTFVRVIAGFDVFAVAVALGLAAARMVKPVIDQALPPGPWWDVLAPWALVTLILTLLLAWLGPVWGNRLFHTALWVAAVLVALVSEAPLGLLLLTWAGVAVAGRAYGKARSAQGQGLLASGHPKYLSFALSPLPWLLLTVFALIGIAYYGQPPVSFSQTTVTTRAGTRVGGDLVRTGRGLYLVSCTPLADATSTNELVSVIRSVDIRSMTMGRTPFVVDSGLRPSLPTVLLHAIGIGASTPAWIRPDVRAIRPTCAGDPLPASSMGYPVPQLGVGVVAGPAPAGGRAPDGESPIEQTSNGRSWPIAVRAAR